MMSPAIYARVQAALIDVEQAQRALERACQELSAIVGLSKEWEHISRLCVRVRAEWYHLDTAARRKADKLKLDSMHQDEEAK